MATDTLARDAGPLSKEDRMAKLRAEDPQFRDSYPLEEVVSGKRQPGVRLSQIVQLVMEGYADRPALGRRARELVTDPATGRSSFRLLPRFDTMTYREVWERARAIAGDWHHNEQNPLKAGDLCRTMI